ncbi:MAG: DUF971 domain-containing protein [Pseudomonadota bacterium]|nr:DUF971 domain-containing protein [Pseudomonadota bacterium]
MSEPQMNAPHMIESQAVPMDITLHRQRSELEIKWSDGVAATLSGETLRSFCACSRCRARNRIGTPLISDNSHIDHVAMAGIAGLQIIFADGHDKGVYPWSYLQAIAAGNGLDHLNT